MKMENNTMPKPIPKIICETKPCFSKVAKKKQQNWNDYHNKNNNFRCNKKFISFVQYICIITSKV